MPMKRNGRFCRVPIHKSDAEEVAHANVHFLMDTLFPYLRVRDRDVLAFTINF